MAKEWKGPWKCERCYCLVEPWDMEEAAAGTLWHDIGHPYGRICEGPFTPVERRAPDPAVEELAAVIETLVIGIEAELPYARAALKKYRSKP